MTHDEYRLTTRYRLTVDLTRYHPEFKVGAVGIEAHHSRRGMWAVAQDRFFPLELPSGACIDVLWSGVQTVTEDR